MKYEVCNQDIKYQDIIKQPHLTNTKLLKVFRVLFYIFLYFSLS